MNTSISFAHMGKVNDIFVAQGVNTRTLQDRLLATGILSDLALAAAVGKIPDRPSMRRLLELDPYILVVDHGLSFRKMINNGRFDFVPDEITENLVETRGWGDERIAAELQCYNEQISTKNAIKSMHVQGYRSGSVEELLTFGAKYPWVQIRYPIIALGSSIILGGKRYAFSLDGNEGDEQEDPIRSFRIEPDDDDSCWLPGVRFLVVPN